MPNKKIWLFLISFLLIAFINSTQALCTSNQECNDSNPLTFDECINPNTTISQCRNTAINCAQDLDCGLTGFIGNQYCSSSDLFKNFQNSTCINQGTLESHCSVIVSSVLFQQCSLSCENNQCIAPVCSSNQECNDSNPLTFDECINPGTPASQCRNTIINCAQDLDCGTNGFTGDEFCSENNVTKNFISFQCNNPGTPQSFCTSSTIPTTLETCQDSCVNASCVPVQSLSITLISPAESQLFSFSEIPLLYSVSGEADNCFYSLDSSPSITLPNCLNSFFNTTEGIHSITIFANNSLFLASDTNSFKVDLSSPSVVLDSPADNSTFENISSIRLKYTPSDFSLSSCTLYTDVTGTFSPSETHLPESGIQDSFTLSLSPGNYTWNVLCKDNALHESFAPSNYTFTIKQVVSNQTNGKRKVKGGGLTDEEINISSRQFIRSEYYAPFANKTNISDYFSNFYDKINLNPKEGNSLQPASTASKDTSLIIVLLFFAAILFVSFLIIIYAGK